jgi:hypothetical protein
MRHCAKFALAGASLAFGLATGIARASAQDLFCEPVECGTFRPLTSQEKSERNDPFFRLVLSVRPDVTNLADVEALIQGTSGTRRLFVVSEEIKDPTQRESRRAVVDFAGSNGGTRLDGNLMLSFSFNADRVREVVNLEAIAWDEPKGVYAYYKLDEKGTPGALTWKLSATSQNADSLSPAQRQNTCLHCHATGVPIMKELRFPWNNWHSGRSRADYLQRGSPGAWPVTADPHFADLADAQRLETTIMSSISRFNNARLERTRERTSQGTLVVSGARRALRPLFETTEVNLVSASQESGLHPFSPLPQTGPSEPVRIPNSFFLAVHVLEAIGITEANQFQSVATIARAEYKSLIERSGLSLVRAEPPGNVRGDAQFAWFGPEPGFVASHWIKTLVDNKVLSPAFVAAVIAVDLETPIFSSRRPGLLAFIPEALTVTPDEPHPDRLTREVIARLEAINAPPGSAEAEFLALLKAPDPKAEVRSRVMAYKDRIAQRLDPAANSDLRNDELRRLLRVLVQRRIALKSHPVFGSLVESEALFPLP